MSTSDRTHIFQTLMVSLRYILISEDPAAMLVAVLGTPRYITSNAADYMLLIAASLFNNPNLGYRVLCEWLTLLQEQASAMPACLTRSVNRTNLYFLHQRKINDLYQNNRLYYTEVQCLSLLSENAQWIPFRNCLSPQFCFPKTGLARRCVRAIMLKEFRQKVKNYFASMPPSKMEFEETKFKPIFICNPPPRHYYINGMWQEISTPKYRFLDQTATGVSSSQSTEFTAHTKTQFASLPPAESFLHPDKPPPKRALTPSDIVWRKQDTSLQPVLAPSRKPSPKVALTPRDIAWRKQDTSLRPTIAPSFSRKPPFDLHEIASYDGKTLTSPLPKPVLEQYIARAVRRDTNHTYEEFCQRDNISTPKWVALLEAIRSGAEIKITQWKPDQHSGRKLMEAYLYAETGVTKEK